MHVTDKKIFKLLPNQGKLITSFHHDMNNKSWEDRNIESEKSAVDGDNVPATESEVDVEKI